MKNKGVSENKARGAGPASPHFQTFLHKDMRILLKTGGFLVTFEVFGNESRASNVETRAPGFSPACAALKAGATVKVFPERSAGGWNEAPQGKTKKDPTEAGISMKTNKTWTNCPE